VFDGERAVGRIYRINAATELWWCDLSFMLTGRKGYGIAETREEAMAAFFYPSEKTSLTDTKSARNPITTALLTD